ncbi:hypothetical protein [Klebsiella pneumoniae IS53]|nr:hypothetical protein [Klebsiella pneumoniae IS53]
MHRRKHVDISRTVHNHRWLIMAHVIVKFRDRPVDVLTHSPREVPSASRRTIST